MANRERFNRILLYTLAVLGVAADQATKYGVFAWLSQVPGNRYVIFRTTPEPADELHGFALVVQHEHGDEPGHPVLTYADGTPVPHVNHGALFGFLRDRKTPANVGFAVVSLAAAAAIVCWSRLAATARDRWLCAALGLILAGTLGNLYDRVRFNGVRDFLHWDYLYNWPVFNVADCCLVAGAGLLLLQAFAKRPAAESPTTGTGGLTVVRADGPFVGAADGASG
jgi:lipoprotein signal peptidase